MTWKPAPLELHWPITTATGQTIKVLERTPFSVEQHRAALKRAGDDNDDQFEELAMLLTGQPREVIEQLKRPDYVSLSTWIAEYVNLPASYFLGAKPEDPDDAPMLYPITAFGKEIDRVRLEVPTMKATKVMMKLKDGEERAIFISSHCTSIASTEILRMSVPDWTQLQERLFDFLNKPADYFRKTTST